MIRRLSIAFLLAALATPAPAEPMPANAEAMLRAAAAKSDGALAATADIAKTAFPRSEKEISALVKEARDAAEAKRQRKLRHQGFLRGWKGQGNAGFSDTQGNNNSTGVTAGVNLVREGLAWTHKADASLDFQRDKGKETRGRYFTAYQSNYRFSDRLYLLGLASWESDRFAGFDSRTTEALGFGYSLIRQPDVSLSVEGGPALRQVRITKPPLGQSKCAQQIRQPRRRQLQLVGAAQSQIHPEHVLLRRGQGQHRHVQHGGDGGPDRFAVAAGVLPGALRKQSRHRDHQAL